MTFTVKIYVMKWKRVLVSILFFFNDKGMPALATTIKEGSKFRLVYDFVADLKVALIPALYNELIENSFYYTPPYLFIYGFMKQLKKWPMLCLTIMEWQDERIKEQFIKYVNSSFKNIGITEVNQQIKKFISSLKIKQINRDLYFSVINFFVLNCVCCGMKLPQF